MVTAELFSIGSELVLGRIQDTNSFWMAAQLTELGVDVRRLTVLPDDVTTIESALRDSLRREPSLLFITGGLGPTPDDLTVACVSTLLGVEPAPDEGVIADYMRRRDLGRREDVTGGLLKMATIPAGSVGHLNPVGWAPCIQCRAGGTVIFILPGPPREMEACFTTNVAPWITANTTVAGAAMRVGVTMYESEVSPLMEQVMAEHAGVYLKAYVALRASGNREEHLPVDLLARGDDRADATARLAAAVERFAELVRAAGRDVRFQSAE
jgi:molybdenum cofactor synthesis domain-containing protein